MHATAAAGERSNCPIARALDLLGDKWTLLVVRDLLFFGKHRFGELETSRERIPTNLLADRLERLRAARLVTRRRYQARPPRYEYHLTAKGRALAPVLRELASWSLGRRVEAPPTSTTRQGDVS